MTTAKPFRSRLARWLESKSDDAVLRALFGAMLTTAAIVLAFDYAELDARSSEPTSITRAAPAVSDDLLPVARPDGGTGPGNRLSDASFRSRMSFDLVADGRLMAVGTIEPGAAARFAAEIEKRGSYVKRIVLHSPGGSVSDALAMGRLIRSRGFATEVEGGRTCASSCPLVFAGGVERRAGEKSAIGVHQVFAADATRPARPSGMDDGQRVSAQCQKFLRDMGVDPQVWVHAMETPKEQLYYFKPDELIVLKLATRHGDRPASEARVRS
jgi:hypothetical protein